MPRTPAAPFHVDRDVDDEKEFWKHIGALIDQAIEKALVKRDFGDALRAMQSTARTQKLLAERVAELGVKQASLATDFDRIIGHITVKSADDDLLRLRLDKFFELVTPPIPAPTVTPPSPPEE